MTFNLSFVDLHLEKSKELAKADYVIIESTYGNRLHSADRSNVIFELAGYIQKALDRGGNVVIPSFAVGRTQEMLYAIREIKQNGLVKGHEHFPVYVDSPLAAEATAIFMQCNPVCFDKETLALYKRIPLEGEIHIESLVDGDRDLRSIMKTLLKLEMGHFIVMLPGERVKRNLK